MKKLQSKKRKRPWIIAAAALSIVAAAVAAVILWMGDPDQPAKGTDDIKDGYYLLTIDGYGVTEEEFRLFLNNERALTASYYYQRYNAQTDADFWDRTYDGQTPLAYAKAAALDKLLAAKMEFILADERDIRAYTGFDELVAEMDKVNAERAQKSEDGEVIYGLAAYDAFTYYNYVRSNLWAELKRSQETVSGVTDQMLEPVYQENIGLFDKGIEFTYTIQYTDGQTETVTMTPGEVEKEDYETMALLELLAGMEENQSTGEMQYKGAAADITLLSKKALGYESFSDARDYVKQMYAEQALSDVVAGRVANAELTIDQRRYDAIRF